MALVEEAAGGGDIAGRLALPQEPGRGAEAPVEEIGMRGQAGFLGEGADEVAARQAGEIRKIGKVRLLVEMGVEIIAHPQDALRAVADGRQGIEIGPAGDQAA